MRTDLDLPLGPFFHLDHTASFFDQDNSGRNVPEVYALLDVGVQAASGDIGEVQRC